MGPPQVGPDFQPFPIPVMNNHSLNFLSILSSKVKLHLLFYLLTTVMYMYFVHIACRGLQISYTSNIIVNANCQLVWLPLGDFSK